MLTREKVAEYFDTDKVNVHITNTFYNLNCDGWMEQFWDVEYDGQHYVFDAWGCMVYKVEEEE